MRQTPAFVEDVSAQLEQLMDIGLLHKPEEFTQAISRQPELLQEMMDGAEVLDVLGKQLLEMRLEEARAEGAKGRRHRNENVPAPVRAVSGQTGVEPAQFSEQQMKNIAKKLERGEKVYLG
ncbi:MAG: hypothetical protein PHD32_11855 [Eubacteriales bacterium]|nr:hypothetical protein [Eubacteriales bacterium]